MSNIIVDERGGDVLLVQEPSGVVVVEHERTAVVLAPGEQGPPGPTGGQGADGPPGEPGLRVTGAVENVALLPPSANPGETWVTRSDGRGHAWNGVEWLDIGPIAFQGPAGLPGKDGQIRYTGHGTPSVIVGAEPGDTYLDLLTGVIYKLL